MSKPFDTAKLSDGRFRFYGSTLRNITIEVNSLLSPELIRIRWKLCLLRNFR